jgi:DnaJ-class molecular chaperone
MKKAFGPLFALAIAFVMVLSTFQPVFAQGPFDTKCPQCNGSGKTSSTSTCTTCNGSGDVPSTSTCSVCKGSGETLIWQTCGACYGSGDIAPTITRKSQRGWLTLVGFDWVARVDGVFHNEEDTGTYFVAKSEVHTVTETFYHFSTRTYIAPHADVTITIDTSEVEFLTDWTYTIYVSSKDDVTCPVCDGSGGQSVLATCSDCSGVGRVTTVQDCAECDGVGEITTLNTCTTCKGTGYVTNQSAVNLAIVAVAVVVIGVVLGLAFAFSGRRKRVLPK